MTKFMYPYLGIITAEEQKHSHTQATTIAPMGHNAASVGAVGTLAADKEHDKSNQRLGQAPGPLPYPKQ